MYALTQVNIFNKTNIFLISHLFIFSKFILSDLRSAVMPRPYFIGTNSFGAAGKKQHSFSLYSPARAIRAEIYNVARIKIGWELRHRRMIIQGRVPGLSTVL
jgi:hypothetical protein